jgi:hypothetical protein
MPVRDDPDGRCLRCSWLELYCVLPTGQQGSGQEEQQQLATKIKESPLKDGGSRVRLSSVGEVPWVGVVEEADERICQTPMTPESPHRQGY